MVQTKSGQGAGKKTGKDSKKDYPKTDLRHWENRIYIPNFQKGGASKFYCVQIQANGVRRKLSVKLASKRKAAERAKLLWELANRDGWDSALASVFGDAPEKRSNVTLGEWLTAIQEGDFFTPKTLQDRLGKIRTIAAAIGRVPEGKGESRFDYVHGGAQRWRDKVDSIPLNKLSDKAIESWRKEFLKPTQDNPEKRKTAIVTSNSYLRAGKAVFKPEIIEELQSSFALPEPLPFRGVKLRPEPKKKYLSEIDNAELLLVAGKRELWETTWEQLWEERWRSQFGDEKMPVEPNPKELRYLQTLAQRRREAFKFLILGLVAGLRREEIDRLQWRQVNFNTLEIIITETDCFSPKSDSSGEIPLDEEVMDILRSWKADSTSRFVVDGPEPSEMARSRKYRAQEAGAILVEWLKGKGISKANKPIHALRKEFGSILCQKAGIYVAASLLRHADIRTTTSSYTDKRGRVTSGLGKAI